MDKNKIKRNILSKIDVYNNFISYFERKGGNVSREETSWLMPFMDKVDDCLMALKIAEVKLNELYYMLDIFYTEKFGKCADCGKELNKKEMVFMPENSKCVECDPYKFLHIHV